MLHTCNKIWKFILISFHILITWLTRLSSQFPAIKYNLVIWWPIMKWSHNLSDWLYYLILIPTYSSFITPNQNLLPSTFLCSQKIRDHIVKLLQRIFFPEEMCGYRTFYKNMRKEPHNVFDPINAGNKKTKDQRLKENARTPRTDTTTG